MRLLSPVFFKETTQLANGRGLWLSKTLLLWLLWLGALVLLWAARREHDPGELAEYGRVGFTVLGYLQLAAVLLLAPLVSADCVCGEREAKTLGLLFLTRLTGLQIVQDKGLARLLFLANLLACTLPFLLACLLLGGVETQQVVNLLGTLAGSMLLAGGIALWASAHCTRYGTALATSYVLLALWLTVGTPLFAGCAATCSLGYATFEDLPFWQNPVLALHPENVDHSWSWVGQVLLGALVYLLALWRATRRVRRRLEPLSVTAQMAAVAGQPVMRRDLLAWFRPWHPARLLHRRGRPGYAALAWKEADGLYDGPKFAAVNVALGFIFVPLLLAALCGVISGHAEVREWGGALVVAEGLLALLLWLLLAAACVARERQQQTLEILLTTRLSGRAFVLGHLQELCKYWLVLFVPVLALSLVHMLVLAVHDLDLPASFLLLPPVLAVTALLLAVLALRASLRARSTPQALGRLALSAGLWFLLPTLVVWGTQLLLDEDNMLHELLQGLWMTIRSLPLVDQQVPTSLSHLIESLTGLTPWPYLLVLANPHEDMPWGFMTAIYLLVYGSAALALLLHAILRFDHRTGRQPW